MGWVGYVVRTREMRNAYNILVIKFEGKTPLGKLGRKRNDNIKVNLKEVWNVTWIQQQQDRIGSSGLF
jgi:hypothetical protein